MKPILFNTNMVKAILANRKTCTRRLMKPQPHFIMEENKAPAIKHKDGISWINPPYQVGDILYVRETWQFIPCIDCEHGKCNLTPVTYEDADSVGEGCFVYRADYDTPQRINWNASIHMPGAAARLFLKVTDVRFEKLQDITEEQAKAEGSPLCIEYIDNNGEPVIYEDEDGYYDVGFKAVWNGTIQKGDLPQYGWDANPWVWVIKFEKTEKEE